jgi:hypothetical protein
MRLLWGISDARATVEVAILTGFEFGAEFVKFGISIH